MSHAKLCRYCRRDLKGGGTVDHVVPKWVIRLFLRQIGGTPHWHVRNRVTACGSCNRRKGSMPAAVFLAIHLEQSHVLKAARSRWDRIAAEMATVEKRDADAHPLAVLIVEEYSRRIPDHFPVKRVTIGDVVGPAMVEFVRGR